MPLFVKITRLSIFRYNDSYFWGTYASFMLRFIFIRELLVGPSFKKSEKVLKGHQRKLDFISIFTSLWREVNSAVFETSTFDLLSLR